MKFESGFEPRRVEDREERLQFFGPVKIGSRHEVGVWVEIRHMRHEPSEIVLELRYSPPLENQLLALIGPVNKDRYLEIEFEEPYPGRIRAWNIGGGFQDLNGARYEIGDYEVLPRELDLPTGVKVEAIIELTTPGLMNPDSNRLMKYDGTIERLFEDRKRIEWSTAAVDYSFQMMHDFEDCVSGEDRSVLLRNRPCIVANFWLSEETEIPALLESTASAVKEPLLLFSFLSRRRIQWVEIRIKADLGESAENRFVEATRRCRFWSRSPKTTRELPAFDENELASGKFLELQGALAASPLREELKRSIEYHLSSRNARGGESNFLLAFAAFETVINAMDAAAPLVARPKEVTKSGWEKRWKALFRSVRRVIDDNGDALGLNSDQLELVKAKATELRRPPFHEKAIQQLSQISVDTSHIWRDPETHASTFEDGLRRAAQSRNFLVHDTKVSDFLQLSDDLVRLRVLFERTILTLLGSPEHLFSRVLDDLLMLDRE